MALTLICDRCGQQTQELAVSAVVDWKWEELNLPKGWFEYQDRLYCDRHKKVPQSGYRIEDK